MVYLGKVAGFIKLWFSTKVEMSQVVLKVVEQDEPLFILVIDVMTPRLTKVLGIPMGGIEC